MSWDEMGARVERFARSLRDRHEWHASQAMGMCANGEWGMAIEDLLSNVHEDGAILSDGELDVAESILRDLGFSVMLVEAIRGLPRDGEGRRRAAVFTVAYLHTTAELQHGLATALQFPDSHGRDWDAFWDAITGVVQMPHVVKIWGWETLCGRSPDDARRLLSLLLAAKRQHPELAADVALYTRADGALVPTEALARLEDEMNAELEGR